MVVVSEAPLLTASSCPMRNSWVGHGYFIGRVTRIFMIARPNSAGKSIYSQDSIRRFIHSQLGAEILK